jgi:hypothetical protein
MLDTEDGELIGLEHGLGAANSGSLPHDLAVFLR